MRVDSDAALVRKIMEKHRLGALRGEPARVFGGFLHRMYRAETEAGHYAVKPLNPEIMKRPDAAANFDRAEALERLLQAHGLPVVAALEWAGRKRQEERGRQYYIFPWVQGKPAPEEEITVAQCAVVGDLLGRIHRLEQREEGADFTPRESPWADYIAAARRECPEICGPLTRSRELLIRGQESLNRALEALSPMRCVINGDMDPKNVLWEGEEPRIIDLECLDWGHPFANAFQLALQWSGCAAGALSPERFTAFIAAYRRAYGACSVRWEALYGLGFSDVDWLEYNIKRALGMEGGDGEERRLGAEQVLETLQRIAHYAAGEGPLIRLLSALSE